jgi:fructose-1,6-bisphosphatase/inositol monophosphatase family enzyme
MGVIEDPDADQLSVALAEVGRAVRDAVLAVPRSLADAAVTRIEGGDEIFGVDARADRLLLAELTARCAERWPGQLVMEGFDEPVPIGQDGDWVYLADPVDGTRPWLAGKRSAWILLGAGRDAATLNDLEAGAAVELPTERSRWARVAWAWSGGGAHAVDDDLAHPGRAQSVSLQPRQGSDLRRAWVTVARYSPGQKGVIGAWEDDLLHGLEVFEDPYLCSGGQLMGLASGQDAAVLDPRPLFGAALCAHPYDLAAMVVAREAGVVVESLPPGPLRAPLDPTFDVAWAGYANEEVAAQLRARMPAL